MHSLRQARDWHSLRHTTEIMDQGKKQPADKSQENLGGRSCDTWVGTPAWPELLKVGQHKQGQRKKVRGQPELPKVGQHQQGQRKSGRTQPLGNVPPLEAKLPKVGHSQLLMEVDELELGFGDGEEALLDSGKDVSIGLDFASGKGGAELCRKN